MAFRAQGGQTSSATINVNSNGTINIITGSVDIGGTRTAIAMQAAEVLGISSEDVNPSVGDTDSVGLHGQYRRQPDRFRYWARRHCRR